MRHKSTILIASSALFIGGALLLNPATAQPNRTEAEIPADGVFIARGDYAVSLMTDGATSPTNYTRVTEVSLLRDWAVIQRSESGRNITLVVPRDAMISLEMAD